MRIVLDTHIVVHAANDTVKAARKRLLDDPIELRSRAQASRILLIKSSSPQRDG
jgi:hypothetical protein